MTVENQAPTQKQITVRAITDFIILTYHPQENPCVLMWRELMNRFRLEKGLESETWTRDDRTVHEHCQRFLKHVRKDLERLYHVTVIPVGGDIRKLVTHGMAPERDNKRRTDKAYCRCLSGPFSKTLGFVCFPANKFQDHPLLLVKLNRRGVAAAHGLENAIGAVDTAEGRGVLSTESRDKIRDNVLPIVHKAVEEKAPLFNAPRPTAIDQRQS